MKDKTAMIKEELAAMRAKMEELRVQGNLGKMELRDKLAEVKGTLDPAFQKAKGTIKDLASSGIDESVKLARSLEAGWAELWKTHQSLSAEAERAQAAAHEAKRKGKS
ncbi:MAG: hypothetical protein H6830_10925 [Planctomycetes bacterium]|nr:hypothetical protein [Planctomycetota bacterium]HPF13199.1 hypothetical protein [Planctomycetota bacterium]HRV79867.1 hypothetical protein [Planctomycetota bacterium]